MSRGEVAMVRPRTAASAFLRFEIHRGRAPLIAGAVLALGIVGTAAIILGAPDAVAPRKAVRVLDSTAFAGSSAELAAVRRPVEATPQRGSDEQRRFRMLLLMNSAARVPPFGGLSR